MRAFFNQLVWAWVGLLCLAGSTLRAQGDAIATELRDGRVEAASHSLIAALGSNPDSREGYQLILDTLNRARASGSSSAWLAMIERVRARFPSAAVPAHLEGFLAGELKLIQRAHAAFAAIPSDKRGPSVRQTQGNIASRGYDSRAAIEVLQGRDDELGAEQRAYHERLQGARDAAANRQWLVLGIGLAALGALVTSVARALDRAPAKS